MGAEGKPDHEIEKYYEDNRGDVEACRPLQIAAGSPFHAAGFGRPG